MARKEPLPFDPIDEAARQWEQRWSGVEQMRAVTNLMRVQQLVLAELDEILRDYGLTFARYEALVLLTFSTGRRAAAGQDGRSTPGAPHLGHLDHRPSRGVRSRRTPRHPTDGRTVLAEITAPGREVVEARVPLPW